MPRFLALDWDHSQLHLIVANIKKYDVQIVRALTVKEDSVPNLATAEALGQRLRDLLKTEKIAPAPVLVSVGRDRVILKEALYPQVPPLEEPAIVRFQALKELTHAPEEVVIDYERSPDPGPNGERRAWVLILRRELLQTYQTLCKAAGLKLAGITPRPFGTALCVQRVGGGTTPVEGTTAALTVADGWAEFCVVRDGKLLLARAVSATAAGAENALLGEIRRNLAIYAGQAPHHPVRALYMAESGNRLALRELLQNTLAIPVHPLDPFGMAQQEGLPARPRGSFAGLVGLLYAQAAKDGLPINFITPKEPKPERDPHRMQLLAGVAASVLLLLGGAGWGYSRIHSLDKQIDAQSRRKIEYDGLLATFEEDARRINEITNWVETEVVWLDELYDLAERFPSIDQLQMTHLDAVAPKPAQVTGLKKITFNGSMKMEVATTPNSTTYVDNLINNLTKEHHYKNVGSKIPKSGSGIGRGRSLSRQFEWKLDVSPRPPDQYKLHLNATAPERPKEEEPAEVADNQGGQP